MGRWRAVSGRDCEGGAVKLLGLGMLLSVCVAAAAQNAQPPAPIERRGPQAGEVPTIRVESRLVPVAVNVVDEKGAPVAGLTQDDFEVREEGKPQKIAVFDRESKTPLSIVLAIDSSESIFNAVKLEREAAKRFVRSLMRPQDEVELMDFADNVREIVPFTSDTRQFDGGLGRLLKGDETALYNAVFLASQRLAETSTADGRRRVIVIISDGEDTVRKGSTYPQALEQAQRASAMIYPLIMVPIWADAGRNTGGEHALIEMANDTGGKFYYVEERKELASAFQHVSDDLRTQYTLGYYAPQRGGDRNGFRKIEVRLKDPVMRGKYTLRYRTGYYGRKPQPED